MASSHPGGSGRPPNRLAHESSPYLLQHAHNPVDWWPWCADAFEEARRRDVPVFLSIGYSTCYWCHVMERESFENEATARLMNERFVSIKLDREERPDVDDIYMAATQILTGRGGWPMSVFLEPKTLRPFWAGTYYPPEPRHGLPSFKQVLEGMSDAYRDKRTEVMEQASKLGQAVEEHLASGGATHAQMPVAIGMGEVSGAVGALLKLFDRTDGGFGRAPKFPQPVYLDLLLDARRSAGDDATRSAIDHALTLTLDRMAIGGMFDQVGGGFHRYSVDAHWTVPHFEKMLYDNAMLLGVYADAARTLDDGFYARIVARTIDYLLREMVLETQPSNGPTNSRAFAFATAQDAEVDGHEGKNYVWTREEVMAALGDDDGAFACRVYGVDSGPNFKDPHHPDEPAVSVLRMQDRPEHTAAAMDMEVEAFTSRLDDVNEKLLRARAARKQANIDDKIIAGWNGLAIAGLARAGDVDARALNAARRAANFLIEHMIEEDATLYRIAKIGAGDDAHGGASSGETGGGVGVKHAAPLEDYAFVIHGMTTLAMKSESDRQVGVTVARALAARARDLFWDDEGGGYYDTMPEAPDLFVRARSTYDGAIPCATSVMIHALIDLHELTGERAYLEDAVGTLAAISPAVKSSPVSTANSTRALLRLLAGGMIEESSEAAEANAAARERAGNEEEGLRTPIEVYASVERVTVKDDEPAEVTVKLRVLPGYHVISPLSPVFAAGNDAAALVPLHAHIIGGSGVRVYADYPQGTPLATPGVDGTTGIEGVHGIEGEFELRLAIERDPDQPWKGNPLIAITFQACTNTACEKVRTLELDVAIDRG
ncbi:MAG: thioredoxin domain-containing protein [Phycisphaeraceae bacterium]|nr:thioredoxin domain-containing protein [Phycisphaeraceae bacterium]